MKKKGKIAEVAVMISMFTLISKVLGFLREIMIANRFGSGMETDTYFVAITATVIIVGTLGAAINTTLIPIFSEIGQGYGRRGKIRFLNNIVNLVLIVTLLIVVFGYFLSPMVIRILASGFEGEQFDLAVTLNRIGLPIAVFLGLIYVFTAFLHSNQVFGPPAISGLPYNFVFLIYLFFFAESSSIVNLMIVAVLATSTQFLILLPGINNLGYRYKFETDFRNKYIKRTMLLVLPVLIGSAVQQINLIIDKTLASNLMKGSISALNYSAKISDMVIAVFIMAITTAIFPMLSEAFSQEDDKKMKEILGQGINIVLLVTVPATVGLLILAEPIVYLFFERNAFDAIATYMTSQALIFYSLGLVGASLRLMLNKVYYSLQDTRTPMINGAIAVIINLILNLILIRYLEHRGLALATSISTTITTILLFISLRKKIGPLGLTGYLICFLKTLAASLVMGLVVFVIYHKLGTLLELAKIGQMILLVISVGTGALVYFGLCIVFKVRELELLLKR